MIYQPILALDFVTIQIFPVLHMGIRIPYSRRLESRYSFPEHGDSVLCCHRVQFSKHAKHGSTTVQSWQLVSSF